MRVITAIVGTIPDDVQPPRWPVDTLGNAQVPRVGDDVVLPNANLIVRGVYWNPLGDPEGLPAEGIGPGDPFVYVLLGDVPQ